MIDKEKFKMFHYIKREDYVGSMDGMRYMLHRKEVEEATVLEVIIWPEPLGFSKTDEKKKQYYSFEFSQEGLSEAVDWLNEQLESQKALWDLTK